MTAYGVTGLFQIFGGSVGGVGKGSEEVCCGASAGGAGGVPGAEKWTLASVGTRRLSVSSQQRCVNRNA